MHIYSKGVGYAKNMATVCVGDYISTPRRKTLAGGGISTTQGSKSATQGCISRITRIMLTNEVNVINDLADSRTILTAFDWMRMRTCSRFVVGVLGAALTDTLTDTHHRPAPSPTIEPTNA